MGTDVRYGPITMKNVTTRTWEQDIAYDESNTDRIGSRFNLMFDGVIHAEDLTVAAALLPPTYITNPAQRLGQSAQEAYQFIRKNLEQPRQELHVTINGETMLKVIPAVISDLLNEQMDVDNGPKPGKVVITHIAGAVFRVSFPIQVMLAEAAEGGGRAQHVLNNRWSISEEFDSAFYCTRTIRGRLRLSNSLVPAHAYKALVVPGREGGFRRERMSFTVDATGLNCDYEVSDRQVHTAAPAPAIKMDVRHTEATSDGVTFYTDLSVRLVGSPEASKSDLFTRMFQIADNRIKLSERVNQSAGASNNALVEQFALTDIIGEENIVEGQFRFRIVEPEADVITSLFTQKLGQPLELPGILDPNAEGDNDTLAGSEYNPIISRFPALYGYDAQGGVRSPAVALLLSCYQQTTADDKHGIAQFDTTTGEAEGEDKSKEEIGPIFTYKSVPQLPAQVAEGNSDSHLANMYLFARVENCYHVRAARVQLPIAETINGPQQQATSVVITLGRGFAYRKIKIDAERIGAYPELPLPVDSYQDNQITATLLDHSVTPLPPCKSADGKKKIFRLMATYIYGLSRPYGPGETIPTGRLPYTSFSPGETAMVLDDVYRADLLT